MSSPLPGSAPPGPLLPAGNPRVVGIVNITADSFSDGGRYLDPAAAVARARKLRAEGADVIELGPAASHPDSAPVSAAEEQRRLAPVLRELAADAIPV
jgi:dihydropteroate synthase type 2